MGESKLLKRFFEDQHRKWKKRSYDIHQCTCGNCAQHSEYSEWLKHRNEDSSPYVPTEPREHAHHARD